jgi:hypothetical protein
MRTADRQWHVVRRTGATPYACCNSASSDQAGAINVTPNSPAGTANGVNQLSGGM